jgi:hypothetical protein
MINSAKRLLGSIDDNDGLAVRQFTQRFQNREAEGGLRALDAT